MQSQLTASTGLGDNFLLSSSNEEEEKEDELVVEDNNADGTFDANIFDKNYDDIADDGVDANVNDYAADKYDFNERLHHYMEFAAISSRNVRAVEYCCMTQANTIVYNNQTKGRAKLDEEQLREYLKLVRDIPDAYFVNHTVKADMLIGYVGMRGKTAAGSTGKKKEITAGPFARRQATVVAKVRFFASNFPKTLPSGKSPCDVRKAFIVKVWKADKHARKLGAEVSHHIYYVTVQHISILTF